ncbi:ParB/RepB/Spo0J family partition protein [Enterococcus faecalis]|uniref:IbrB-like domain-containing protein n=1 Tax=Enterococcus faecalis TaxID=1351 RepID=UPI002DBCCA0E|nr:ParB/RepB/Spo0J family partition protein [Enterococcus faecalis]MEB7776297.1 ParB/RepB/Spo0J family partition protein [Enterococcus faecalis]
MASTYLSPVYNVQRISIKKIKANKYNPNKVASPEMKLLIQSIREDGYTMPIVCYYNEMEDFYEIVDGFHRYLVMKTVKEIYQRENGQLPVVIIDRPLSDRIASTIRHNRARGTHSIDLMLNIVKQLNEAGVSDQWMIENLGMDKDELLRLKQITGLSSLFVKNEFSEAWGMIEEI